MMLKHFLLVLLLAGLWSFSYSCSRGNGGRGGNGGNSGGNGNGGNGGSGGNGRKRSPQQAFFSLDFAVFDADGNGKISRTEFLDLQPDHESLFDKADTNGDGLIDCEEFSAEVGKFGGEANCKQ